jgi:hypothetical protein
LEGLYFQRKIVEIDQEHLRRNVNVDNQRKIGLTLGSHHRPLSHEAPGLDDVADVVPWQPGQSRAVAAQDLDQALAEIGLETAVLCLRPRRIRS